MIQKFTLVGKGEPQVTIHVRVRTKRGRSTRAEGRRRKELLRNMSFDMLRKSGFNVSEIVETRTPKR